MCDYSLTHLASRPAVVGDKLHTNNFGYTTGFCGEDPNVAVCLLPGTEIAFEKNVSVKNSLLGFTLDPKATEHKTAIFRQINMDCPNQHHDQLEFPDGEAVFLNELTPDQAATVLQLPAQPRVEAEPRDEAEVKKLEEHMLAELLI